MAKKKRLKEEDCTYVIVHEEDHHRYRTLDPDYSDTYAIRVHGEEAMDLEDAARNGQIHNHFDLVERKKKYQLPLFDAIRIKEDEDSDDDC